MKKDKLNTWISRHTKGDLCRKLNVNQATYSRWQKIPKKYQRLVIEWIEELNDDGVDIITKLQ